MCKDFIMHKVTRVSGVFTLLDAFRAGGFDDSEVFTYVRAMRERIGELQNLR